MLRTRYSKARVWILPPGAWHQPASLLQRGQRRQPFWQPGEASVLPTGCLPRGGRAGGGDDGALPSELRAWALSHPVCHLPAVEEHGGRGACWVQGVCGAQTTRHLPPGWARASALDLDLGPVETLQMRLGYSPGPSLTHTLSANPLVPSRGRGAHPGNAAATPALLPPPSHRHPLHAARSPSSHEPLRPSPSDGNARLPRGLRPAPPGLRPQLLTVSGPPTWKPAGQSLRPGDRARPLLGHRPYFPVESFPWERGQ